MEWQAGLHTSSNYIPFAVRFTAVAADGWCMVFLPSMLTCRPLGRQVLFHYMTLLSGSQSLALAEESVSSRIQPSLPQTPSYCGLKRSETLLQSSLQCWQHWWLQLQSDSNKNVDQS